MKLYAVQHFNKESKKWETCQTFEEIDNGKTESMVEIAAVYFDKKSAIKALDFWSKDTSSSYRVSKVKLKEKHEMD